MMLSFLIYFIIWIILINIFSETINFSNREIIPSLALIIFFSLGYAEFFSMIGRGFSLRILTDIYINKSNTKQQIVNKYADGKGIDWMIQKRLQTMKKLKLIEYDGTNLNLIFPQGFLCAYFAKIFKLLLNLNKKYND